MLANHKLAFVGSGVMAEAMIKGILNRGLVAPEAIMASGPREERGADLRQRYGVASTTDNVAAVERAGVVVLSVKPQMVPKVLPQLRGKIEPHAMVLSIVAGTRLHTLVTGLSHESIARAMPNTPAQVGAAMTVWTTSPATTAEQKDQAQQILAALGDELWVEEENYLDMATALSGTGPAYVFLFMEALVDAGVHLGFSRRVSQRLVKQTILGSALFAQQSQLHPAELRNMVTSPGGTTAEALYQLEKGGVRTVLSRAVWAAYQKTRILGGEEDK
ncbi:MAG TPA: pyrroline-5-carboxylate reductase [Anaerolineae bacterium]|nr:pyrroline-5-carboxylate reductase [Anaerolineae bacterium]HNT05512.1 pyrroline-5-carboxylate reductase [Anaerolineae bacterium]